MAGLRMWARHIFFQTVMALILCRYLYYEIVLFSCLPALYIFIIDVIAFPFGLVLR